MDLFLTDSTWDINKKAVEVLHHKQIALFACDVAREVLPIYEQYCPKDKRPRTVIEMTEMCVYGKITKTQVSEATMEEWSTVNTAVLWSANTARSAASTVTNARSAAMNITTVIGNANTAVSWAANIARTVTNANTAVSWAANTAKIQRLHQQALPVTIPITPTLQSIAENIITTRKFEEYYVLLDNLEEVHNITLPREVPLGLSHYVLFTLTNTH